MTRLTRKYEFVNEAAADAAIALLPTDEEGNPTHEHLVTKLGYLVVTPPIFDNEFEDISGYWGEKNELVMSVRSAVDGGQGGCCRSWACDHQIGQNHDGNSQFLDTLTIWNNS